MNKGATCHAIGIIGNPLMNKGATCHVIGTIGNPSMNRFALNWFHIVSTYGGKNI
jgi:hypothetical protein